ncbi:MAG TPA: class I SAM-dependent methyltransferase, partial [Chromatiales bacterium]|nr:class I SAM-dependent methyltransferase [Chromatiales bacterium]
DRIPPLARQRVLEIGIATGENIPFYDNQVEHLFGLEPEQTLLDAAEQRASEAAFPVDLIAASAEDIPLEDACVDTVVSTWTLCSIPQVERALQEMRRVLKPGGRLLFIEHGRAPQSGMARWQDRLTPVSRTLFGCRMNRPMESLIDQAGFEFLDLDKVWLEGPRLLSYHYIGQATPR